MSVEFLESLERVERRWEWQSLVVDGYEWRWLDTACEGAVAVLLPGSMGDAGVFALTLEAMGDEARLVAVTYPALSDPAALADGLAALLDHLAVESATVVGSSFAAWWSQYFALRHPRLVANLVIGNGFVEGNDLAGNPLFDRESIRSTPAEELHRQWLDRIESAPASPMQRLQRRMLAERQGAENLAARLRGVVEALPCPALPIPADAVTVLDCTDDPIIPSDVRARVRSRYPGSRHVTLDSGGHYPHLLNPRGYQLLLASILERPGHTKGDPA